MYTQQVCKMREFIGPCSNCGKELFCRDGFLDGIYIDGKLFCFGCAAEKETAQK